MSVRLSFSALFFFLTLLSFFLSLFPFQKKKKMSLILEFCRQIIEGYTNQDAEAFYHLFSVDPSNPITMQLREELDKVKRNIKDLFAKTRD